MNIRRSWLRTIATAALLAAPLGAGWAQLSFVEAPTLAANPTGRVPLAAAIAFSLDQAVESRLTISDGVNSWEAEFDAGVARNGRYTLPVAGMRPGREHTITLAVTGADGGQHTETWTHTTPDLPANPLEFPDLDIQVSIPERMEPGVTFLSVRRRALGRAHWLTDRQRDFSEDWGMLLALDARGDVIWYYNSDFRTAGIARLSNGNILMHRTDFSTVEIDLLGNVVRQFYAEERPYAPPENPDAIPILGQQTLHHQPHEMPNGDFLAFSANGYLIEDYYSSDSDPDAPRADQIVMADTVVQFTPEGETVWTWDTYGALDPFRVGYDTFWSYWWVRGFPDYMDWTHANGLSYDTSDDSSPGVAAEPERHRQGGLRDPGHQVDTRAPRRLARKPAGQAAHAGGRPAVARIPAQSRA